MNGGTVHPPTFWQTVFLLLGASRRRAAGRRKRQGELLQNRAGRGAMNWGIFGFLLGAILMAALNLAAAFVLVTAMQSGGRVEAERDGKIVVESWFLHDLRARGSEDSLGRESESEARDIARESGGDRAAIKTKILAAAHAHGTRDFATAPGFLSILKSAPHANSVPAMLGSLFLIWWGLMIVFQGEGLELDLQRRRHPMWEWLLSHPVPPGAVFLAEMLSPIAANPIYWGAPAFTGLMYGFVYGPSQGFLAALIAGLPISVAAASVGKALEIGITLRFSPRSRGAMIGLMSWFGYASIMIFTMLAISVSQTAILPAIARILAPLAILPWPWIGLFLGQLPGGHFSFPLGILMCWLGAAVSMSGAVAFSIWGARQGLSGNFGGTDRLPSAAKAGAVQFGKEPLYRKELLWFMRDRSAVVQTILIPLTVASYQLFNMRGALMYAQNAWNYLCGAGILFGTYFLWVLGPKSLASEGTALWIALTWPRGLENLLKAKAWLWSLIATGIVGLVFCYSVYLFPASWWKIALAGIGWFFFARSMAEKSVTLVSVSSSSGEQQKIPSGRRWAASLGMLTFCIGMLTQQWHLAIMGIVYSYMTAAAMWQNFRARLPFLFDPWSETLPKPPTLMHAMIAISILVEGGAVLSVVGLMIGGAQNFVVVQSVAYCICAVIVSICLSSYLAGRDVPARSVWYWPHAGSDFDESKSWLMSNIGPYGLLAGVMGGLALGIFAHGYLAVMHLFPAARELIDKGQAQLADPAIRISYTVAAVGFAPFAEEYLFRGLLFRALDREWGGWQAVVGSAAFFAIYHQPFAWLPVGLLGLANALLFKKTGRLAPAVVLHMVYNAVVLT